jgi:uncharacterized protein YcfL
MNYRSMLALIVVGALATGCQSTTPTTGSVEKTKYEVIATGDTESRIDVLNVATGKAGDTLKASVEVKNDSNFNYTFEYRFKWYDGAGMEINPEGTAWMPVAIMAQETKSLQALAPNPSAASFKLFLQEKQ